MESFVVYTVLTGSESQLNNPFPPDCGQFERVCFTDDLSIDANGWNLVKLDGHYLGPRRESRRPKLLPHLYFPGHEWSMYLDNTAQLIMDPLEILGSHANRQEAYWAFRHPHRDCIYDEAEEVIRLGFDDEVRVREQMDYYLSVGHPRHAGLCQNTMLLRKHNDPGNIRLAELWFEHVLRFSQRDQLSFNFVARQLGFEYGLFHGEVTNNPFMSWPGFQSQLRLPGDFDEYAYQWLNPEVSGSGISPRKHYMMVGASRGLAYRKKRWELDRLANKYKTDKGSLYYNAYAYAPVYEYYFSPIKNHSIRLLELGLLRHDIQARRPEGPYDDAPSLFMWREYFPNAALVGFDIADFSKVAEIPGCTIVRGDVGNPDDLLSLVDGAGAGFDIIIDDASHASHHQQIALGTLFPFLKSGGYYIIEGLNYQPPHLELQAATKTKEVLQALRCGEILPSPFMTEEQLKYLADNAATIQFHDSFGRNLGIVTADDMVVIEKQAAGAHSRRPLHWTRAQRRADDVLQEVYASRAWRLIQALRKIRVNWAPPDSLREKLWYSFVRIFDRPGG